MSGSERPDLNSIPYVKPDLSDVVPYLDIPSDDQIGILQVRNAILTRIHEIETVKGEAALHEAEAEMYAERLEESRSDESKGLPDHRLKALRAKLAMERSRGALCLAKVKQYQLEIMAFMLSLKHDEKEIPEQV